MEKFLHRVRYWVRHQRKKLERNFSSHTAVNKIVTSKNFRLAIILVIALAIPLTVLAVQQIQDIRQQAASTPPTDAPPCDGSAGYTVTQSGNTLTFSKTDGTAVSTDTNHFGNGYIQSSCQASGVNLTCQARYRGSGSAIQYHYWEKFPGGRKVCYYAVTQAPTATPDPNRPTRPPRSGPSCEGEVKAECTFDNKPRLRISWDLRGPNTGCSVKVTRNGAQVASISNKCDNKSGERLENVENNATYNLVIDNGTETCSAKNFAVSTQCGSGSGGQNPTNTPAPGQPTNTPAPEQPTNTPTPRSGGNPTNAPCEVTLNSPTSCRADGRVVLTGKWSMNYNNESTCKATLLEGTQIVGDATSCSNNEWESDFATIAKRNYAADKRYTLQIESDLCQKSTPSITATKCTATERTPLGPITNLQGSCTDTKATFSWSPATNAQGYDIRIDELTQGPSNLFGPGAISANDVKKETLTGGDNTRAEYTNIKAGKAYRIYVRARDARGPYEDPVSVSTFTGSFKACKEAGSGGSNPAPQELDTVGASWFLPNLNL